MSELAIDGGTPVRAKPFPERGLIGREEKRAAMQVFDRAIRTGVAFGYNGEPERQYEREFAEWMGGGFADGVNSGTNALFCALGALRLDALSEVIVPPITDPGGVMPVVFLGCVPIVADSHPRSYNTAAAQIEPLINRRTRAIVVAHVAGEPVDLDPILRLARAHNLYVVEDCAQAHGARYKGRLVGTMGDIAAFSTMSGKHHCTGAQGGVVYTRDERLHWEGKRFADRGKPFNLKEAANVVAGLNCNLDDLSAAIGSAQLRKLPDILERRHRLGEAIKEGLRGRKAVFMGWQAPRTHCVYWFLRFGVAPARLKVDKNRFCAALRAEGLPVMVRYGVAASEMPWFRDRAVFGASGFPWTCKEYRGPRRPKFELRNATRVRDTHFNVAMHESYGDRDAADIVAALEKVERAYLR